MLETADQYAAFVELETLTNANLLLTFEASPRFAPFMGDPARFILLRAANRVGKTRHGCARLALDMVTIPGLRCRAVGPTARQTQDVMGRYLAEFLAPYLAPGSYYTEGKGWNTNTIRLANGSVCQLKSLEDNPQSHAGDELDRILLDEVPTRAIFTESLMRVHSRRGSVWVLMTPVDRPVEWFRKVVEAEQTIWTQYVVEFSAEACPWYDDDQVEEHLAVLRASPWDYAQRALGAWDGVTVDRIFTALTEANVSAFKPRADETFQIGITLDHGEKAGREVALLAVWQLDMAMWAGVAQPRVRVHILDEYESAKATSIEEDAVELIKLLDQHNIRPDEVDLAVGDTNAGKAYAGAKVNTALEHAIAQHLRLRRSPFRIQDAWKADADYGLRLINWMLRRGELTVHPRCTSLMKTLRHWKGTTRGDDGELKHFADALRYLLTAATANVPTYDRLRFR